MSIRAARGRSSPTSMDMRLAQIGRFKSVHRYAGAWEGRRGSCVEYRLSTKAAGRRVVVRYFEDGGMEATAVRGFAFPAHLAKSFTRYGGRVVMDREATEADMRQVVQYLLYAMLGGGAVTPPAGSRLEVTF